jgi:tetratricopeptide (TPR) repeat protein
MNYKIILLFLVLFAFASCQNNAEDSTTVELKTLEKSVENKPNGESISQLLVAYNLIIVDRETNRKTLKKTLDKAYALADNPGWGKEQIGIITSYLKEFPADEGTEIKLVKLIDLMSERNQKNTVNALKHSFIEAYPGSEQTTKLKSEIDTSFSNAEAYLKSMAGKVFENVDEIGINVKNAREYVNACEAYALVLPVKEETPKYLFNASEIARTIKTFDKTLYLYDWIIDKYPQFEKAPMALFLKGFILENDLNNMEKAKEVYREFLEKYPAHDLADDVQFLLDNIGKSNEEILKMIEENKK